MLHQKNLSIVVSCIDYRFWPQALPLLKEKYGYFDLITIAGAIKNLTSPAKKESKKTLLENIGISIKLHHPHSIILVNHIDCGAYGGSKNFKSEKEEIEFHKKELEKAEKIIQKKFPQLTVKKEFLTVNKEKIKFSSEKN
ncbi:MAG: hypothetical protein PHG83_02125 [Patescibacteria group bacterium]|nr:hypothetical protein [Patescibacteria group bacterium]